MPQDRLGLGSAGSGPVLVAPAPRGRFVSRPDGIDRGWPSWACRSDGSGSSVSQLEQLSHSRVALGRGPVVHVGGPGAWPLVEAAERNRVGRFAK